MARYIIGRLLQSAATLFFIALITFLMMHVVPGGPFEAMAGERGVSAQFVAAQESYYGLDDPLAEQFVRYLGNLARGDLGLSFAQRGQSVTGLMLDKIRPSMLLGVMSFALVFGLGMPLGVLAAIRRNSAWDYISLAISTLLAAVPAFVLAFILLIVFAVWLGWFDVRLGKGFGDSVGSLRNGILPALALGAPAMALISRLTRSSMLDVLDQDYIRTARAKGLSRGGIYVRHALRNALIPVVTLAGPVLAALVTGSIIVEQIFGIPGIGSAFVTSVFQRDYGMIMGTTMFYATIILVMNLSVDLVYPFVDPRVRLRS